MIRNPKVVVLRVSKGVKQRKKNITIIQPGSLDGRGGKTITTKEYWDLVFGIWYFFLLASAVIVNSK